MGDRQVTYGILWCLWQFAQDLEHQSRQVEDCPPVGDTRKEQHHKENPRPQDPNLADPPPRSIDTERGSKSAVHKRTKVSSKVCPLLIDIPAAILASGEKAILDTCSVGTGFDACDGMVRVPSVDTLWRCEQPFDDDLFPQPSRVTREPTPRVHAAKSNLEGDLKANLGMEGKDRGSEALPSADEVTGESIMTSVRCTLKPDEKPVLLEVRLEEVVAGQAQQQLQEPEAPTKAIEGKSPPPLDELKAEDVSQKVEPGTKETENRPATRTEVSEEVVGEILAWLGHLKIRLSDPAAFLVCRARGLLHSRAL